MIGESITYLPHFILDRISIFSLFSIFDLSIDCVFKCDLTNLKGLEFCEFRRRHTPDLSHSLSPCFPGEMGLFKWGGDKLSGRGE